MNPPKVPIDPLLLKAISYMGGHTDECSGFHTWSAAADHFRTSFDVPIDSDKCGCGLFQTALEVERRFFGNAAIPHQHRDELGAETTP